MGTFKTKPNVSQELFCECCGESLGVVQRHPDHPINFRCYHAKCWLDKETGTYDYADATDYCCDRGTE